MNTNADRAPEGAVLRVGQQMRRSLNNGLSEIVTYVRGPREVYEVRDASGCLLDVYAGDLTPLAPDVGQEGDAPVVAYVLMVNGSRHTVFLSQLDAERDQEWHLARGDTGAHRLRSLAAVYGHGVPMSDQQFPKRDREECWRCGRKIPARCSGTGYCSEKCYREQVREDEVSARLEREELEDRS